jgi:hypothetical protein
MAQQAPPQQPVRREDVASQGLGEIREQLGSARAHWQSGDRSEYVREQLEIAKTAVRNAQTVTQMGYDTKPGPSQSAQSAFDQGTQQLAQILGSQR